MKDDCVEDGFYSASPFPKRRIDVTPKQNWGEGINPLATFHFTKDEIAIILADFIKARGMKNVNPNDIQFKIIPNMPVSGSGPIDPREPTVPLFDGADVQVKLV